MADPGDREKARISGTSRLEWSAAAVSASILAATIAYMAFYGLTQRDGSPKIRLVAGPVERAVDGYVVPFTAHNEGQSTAGALEIRGVLLSGDRVVEASEATIDYVPEQSSRGGGLFFERDPRHYRFSLRSGGYAVP